MLLLQKTGSQHQCWRFTTARNFYFSLEPLYFIFACQGYSLAPLQFLLFILKGVLECILISTFSVKKMLNIFLKLSRRDGLVGSFSGVCRARTCKCLLWHGWSVLLMLSGPFGNQYCRAPAVLPMLHLHALFTSGAITLLSAPPLALFALCIWRLWGSVCITLPEWVILHSPPAFVSGVSYASGSQPS